MERYIVINARRDEYSAKEVSGTMTVGQLINHLQGFDQNMKIMIGNNKQGHNEWYTYGEISTDQIFDVVEEDEEPDEE